MNGNVCYIFGAGTLHLHAFCPGKGDFVVAADAGYLHLEKLGVRPSLVVGDFDSLGAPPPNCEIISAPAEKDDTDMMLAVKTVLERGHRTIVIYGAMGGRFDHTYANLQTLAYLSRRGARAFMAGEGCFITALTDGTARFSAEHLGTVSVFAASGDARGVTLTGLKYPLTNAPLTSEFPRGVSNAFTGRPASISVAQGTLLIIWEDKNPAPWL